MGVLLVGANTRAAMTSVGPVLGDVQHDLHLTASTASALISVPLLAFAIVSPVAPVLGRRFGIERTLALSLAALCVGIVLRSLPAPGMIWIGTVLLGAAIAVMNVELPALVKRDFPTRITHVTGAYSAIQSSFAAIGAGIAVPVAGQHADGWRLSLGVWAGLALIAFAVLAPRLGRRAETTARPVDSPSATASSATERRGAGSATAHGHHRSPWTSLLGWEVALFMGLQSTAYYVAITWMPTIERGAGIDPADAGFHQFLLNACAIGGSIACSAFLPRFRDQRLLSVVSPVLFILGLVGEMSAPDLAAVWNCVMGVSAGATIVLALSFFGLRTVHHAQAATLSGMSQAIGYCLAAAGPLFVGLLHEQTGSWTLPLVFLVAVQVTLAVLGLIVGRHRVIGTAPITS